MKKTAVILLLIIVLNLSTAFHFVHVSSQEEIQNDSNLTIKYLSDDGIDLDGDGLFEYLGFSIEVEVSLPGIFLFEGEGIVDRSGNLIDVSFNSREFLDEGTHNLTIIFDGRMIHSSGLNPMNISYLSVISDDFSSAAFLDFQPLSREYRYDEFEPPPNYKIGVKVGDKIKYDLYHRWITPSSIGNSSDSLLAEVIDIGEQIVTINVNFYYSTGDNGTEVAKGYLEKESQIFPFIISANLSTGDKLDYLGNTRIGLTEQSTVLGSSRLVNRYNKTENVLGENVENIINEEYIWDQETGILTNSWFNVTTTDLFTGDTYFESISILIDRTTLIPLKTQIDLKAISEIKTGISFNLTATLKDYINRRISGEKITLYNDRGEELGNGVTDIKGDVLFTMKIEDVGRQEVRASFTGTGELMPAERSLVLEAQGTFNMGQIILASIVILSTLIVVLFLIRRRRSSINKASLQNHSQRKASSRARG